MLFEKGRALVAQKRFAEACPAFADAHRLKRDAIGITLNLADCYREIDKLASSWSAYREAEFLCRNAGEHEREQYARDGAAALEPKLARLRVSAPALRGLVLHRDDQEVGQAALGTPFPIDAGDHTLQVTAPGYKPWSTVVKIPSDGVSVSIDVPPLLPDDDAPGAPRRPFVWTGQRIAGLGVGLAGVAGAAAGGILGGLALSKYDATKPECSPTQPNLCTSPALSQRSSALKLADASTGLLLGGAVAAAAGVTLLVTAPPGTRPKTGASPRIEASPLAGVGTAGLLLRGVW